MVENIINNKILTAKEFTDEVEKLITRHRVPVMDAILKVCEDTNTDPSHCSQLLSASLKAKLEAEAMELNLIPRGNQLPL